MAKREELDQQEKYQGFKKAHNTYKQYLDQKNYIGAYVIAFSILEDRVNAMYFTRKSLQENRSVPLNERRKPFSKKLETLQKDGDIQKPVQDDWMKCANDRNGKLHAAMWNIDEFTQDDADRVMTHAREANKLRKQQKSKVGR